MTDNITDAQHDSASHHRMPVNIPIKDAYAVLPRSDLHNEVDPISRVLNTAELLELILKELDSKDLLLRAPLVCRAFRTAIESSPTVNKLLGSAAHNAFVAQRPSQRVIRYGKTIKIRLYPESDGRKVYLLDVRPDRISPKDLYSSPSFRKLHMPGGPFTFAGNDPSRTDLGRTNNAFYCEWEYASNRFSISGNYSIFSAIGETTIAKMLESIIAHEPAISTVSHCGGYYSADVLRKDE